MVLVTKVRDCAEGGCGPQRYGWWHVLSGGDPATRCVQATEGRIAGARTVWEQRTGRRLGADGRDDELFSCLRLESRGTDDEKLLENDPIDRLTLFEQALESWTRCWGASPVLHSLFQVPDAWQGTLIVEVDPTNPEPNAFLARHPHSWGYAGWVLSAERTVELRRYCDLRKSPVLGILAAEIRIPGRHMSA
jgi:hypothetical protein